MTNHNHRAQNNQAKELILPRIATTLEDLKERDRVSTLSYYEGLNKATDVLMCFREMVRLPLFIDYLKLINLTNLRLTRMIEATANQTQICLKVR